MTFMTDVSRNPLRVVLLERDDARAKTLHAAAIQAHAVEIERAGTIDTALKTIERAGSNALIGGFDFGDADVRRMIALLRHPTRTPSPHIVIVALTPILARGQAVAIIRLGVNQVVVPPHTTERVRERLSAAWRSPIVSIATPTYLGPCRRRAPDDAYGGPRRRATERAPAPAGA